MLVNGVKIGTGTPIAKILEQIQTLPIGVATLQVDELAKQSDVNEGKSGSWVERTSKEHGHDNGHGGRGHS